MKKCLLAIIVTLTIHVVARADDPAPKSIPLGELGAKASADYKGDAIGIEPTADGARLRTGFQKLAGTVSHTGLVIESTEADGGSLSLVTHALGRTEGALCLLPRTGAVEVRDGTVAFVRPGLVEEYSVSADGVRQDLIVQERPVGAGELTVELALRGALAATMTDGVKLVLDGSRRELAYSRLKVSDATGRELTARLETLTPARLVVRVEDAGAAYPLRIDPTFSDADWVSLNPGIPGAIGVVYAVALDAGGNLYAGGSFSLIGTVVANNVAKWNGSEWSVLGLGTSGPVRALAVDGGNLYVGGEFGTAGGVNIGFGIAKWNGSAWSPLGSGTNSRVYALAADHSGNLYAGGEFTTAGGVSAYRIAKWNGNEWSALGHGVWNSYFGGGNYGSVYALVADGAGNLYAGGEFGWPGRRIAKWNGSEWSSLGSGMLGYVHALAMDENGNIYAGTDYASGIYMWDGSTWSVVGGGLSGDLFGSLFPNVLSLCVDGDGNLYVGGSFTKAGGIFANCAAKWNGSVWSELELGTNSPVLSLAVDGGGNIYAGGRFIDAGGSAVNSIAKWNGSVWSGLGPSETNSGINGPSYCMVVNGSDLYVGGKFTIAGGVLANCIAKWDGSGWTAIGSGMSNGNIATYISALGMDGSGNLYAGGNFTSAGGVVANNIAKWNGSAWSALGSGMNEYVCAIAIDDSSNLYAGGYFTKAGGVTVNHVAKWNGIGWTAIDSGMNGNVFALVVNSSGNLYAGGNFSTAGGVNANGIAKWNGSAWSALGSGIGGSLDAIVVDSSGNLYAGGNFTTAGGIAANHVAKWNGSQWTALGSGLSSNSNNITSFVKTLALDSRGDLYVGGYFSKAGGAAASRIAKWDGSAWSALGTGMSGSVNDSHSFEDATVKAFATDTSDHLFVGGEFYVAGMTFSPYIAQANIRGGTTATITNVRAAQIPGTHKVYITYDLAASVPCTVGVQALLDNPGMSLVVPPAALSGDATGPDGNKVSPGAGKAITLTVAETTNAGTTVKAPDLHNIFTKNLRFKITATP